MPIYEYETVPTRKGEEIKRYEIRQCMEDEPLTAHPETGEAIRKVYTAFAVGASAGGSHAHGHLHTHSSGGHCCGGGGCGCHH